MVRTQYQNVNRTLVTADDVVFSLQRVIKLNKSPAFLLAQFGFTPANIHERIVKTGDY